MAASMKVTYGIIRLINKTQLGICERLSPKTTSQFCANCFSSQFNNCNSNRSSKHCILLTKKNRLSDLIFKGNNSCDSLQFCRTFSCFHGTWRKTQLLSEKYSIRGTSLNKVRCQSAQGEDGNWKEHLTSKSKRSFRLKEVKENIWTIPNLLTISRIALTPVIGYLVMLESYTFALGLFTFAGLTDLLDGYIARNVKNQMSAFGTALDPLADKILITVLTVTLTLSNLIPVPLAVLIVGRDVLLIATGFVIRFISLPPPRTLSRYFDVTNPTAKLLPTLLSKINTTLQLSLVCFTLAAPVFNFVDHQLLQCLWYVTAATTFGSGVDYIFRRKTCVQFLQKKDGIKK